MTDTHLPPLLNIDRVKFIKNIESKKCVFDTITELLISGQSEVTKNEVFDAFIAREKLGNTTIGNGIAIPRAHLDITNPRAALLILKKGIDLNSADKIPVRVFLAILIPDQKRDIYKSFIKEINRILVTDKKYNYSRLEEQISTKNPDKVIKFFESLFNYGYISIKKEETQAKTTKEGE